MYHFLSKAIAIWLIPSANSSRIKTCQDRLVLRSVWKFYKNLKGATKTGRNEAFFYCKDRKADMTWFFDILRQKGYATTGEADWSDTVTVNWGLEK